MFLLNLLPKKLEEICILINKKIKMPFYRIIKKNATFIQSPENFEKIKKIENLPKNLLFQVIGQEQFTMYY